MPDTNATHALWNSVNRALKQLFPNEIYEMWFADLKCVRDTGGELKLEAPNDFSAIWVENNFLDVIAQQARSLSEGDVTVSVQARPQENDPSGAPSGDRGGLNGSHGSRGNGSASAEARPRNTGGASGGVNGSARDGGRNGGSCLNPRNTFDGFVVGTGNQLAHAASVAVANAPGRAYNPLFVFGDTGLGKTHLMHAVAHQMLANKPDAHIAYVSTEKFTNEYIHAIRENKLTAFRRFYRTVDVLLIDDIHFLAGKESTQEEFFHTFNDLFESGRQIFLASDRPANEIEKLENRLVSRFQWGLVTDIQPPDLETRTAILRKKASAMGLELDDGIMGFLAERVSRNVRRMEGALTRLASYNSLMSQELDLNTVSRLLGDLLKEEASDAITVEKIQREVAEFYKVGVSDILGRRRTSQIVLPRQLAMYLSRTLTGDPLASIGHAFGGRDHGTVIHACRQIEHLMDQDGTVNRGVEYLTKKLSRGNP